jgi:hypothetical protein
VKLNSNKNFKKIELGKFQNNFETFQLTAMIEKIMPQNIQNGVAMGLIQQYWLVP